MSGVFGIDVSSWNGVIDWKKVKTSGVDHAVLKVVRKDLSYDKQFLNNLRGVRAQTIPFGVYTYVYEATVKGAQKRAEAAVNALEKNDVPNGTIIWWDLEDSAIQPTSTSAKNALKASVLAAQKVIKAAGYGFGIYTGLWWYKTFIKGMDIQCPYWIARYPKTYAFRIGQSPWNEYKPVVNGTLWGWQYTDLGLVPGCTGNSGHTDLNIVYGATEGGKVEIPKGCVRRGDVCDSVKLMQVKLNEHGYNLAVDGSFGPKTEAAVKDFQRKNSLVVDGICGPKTWAALE